MKPDFNFVATRKLSGQGNEPFGGATKSYTMKSPLFLLPFLLVFSLTSSHARDYEEATPIRMQATLDTGRVAALNAFWDRLSQTVQTGDFEGYAALYHQDAVLVIDNASRPGSMPITQALASWKQGFEDTRSGKTGAQVAFRFSKRLGDATTAHETGMFAYSVLNAEGAVQQVVYVNMQALLVKKEGHWLITMELQGAPASEADWNALKP